MSIIYILTNEAMPGYIKIGRTNSSIEQRMKELDKTSVPLPFQCYYAAKVAKYETVEKSLHKAFGDFRVRESREFFKLDPYKVKLMIELVAIEDVTPTDDSSTDEEGRAAIQRVNRAQRYNLKTFGIPAGAILEYTSDRSITCEVVDEFTVRFNDKLVSISRAAVMANESRGGKAGALQGPIWWLYQGETLASIRDRLEA